jgi:acyl-CoA reductase-like NAD-dependent aldehyde dehydrogenase
LSAADQAYNQALSDGEQKVATAEEAAHAKASPKTPVSEIAPLLDAWATALDSAADDLDGITPPQRAAAANDHLVTALHDFADDLRSAIDEMKSSNKPWLKILTSKMKGATGPQELDAAVKELNALGYGTGAAPSPSG